MPKKLTTREKLILKNRELRAQGLKINPPTKGKIVTNEEKNRSVLAAIEKKASGK